MKVKDQMVIIVVAYIMVVYYLIVIQTFTLNSVKVYTDYPGERTLELRDNNGSLVFDLVVDIPTTNDNGYVVDLDWVIESR